MLDFLLKFASRILLVSSGCCLVIALVFGLRTALFLHNSTAAIATITAMNPRYDAEAGAIEYAPVFSFTSAEGRTYTVPANVATNPPGFTMGQQTRIRYDRRDPAGAKLASFWQLWIVSAILAMIGLGHGTIGYILLLYKRRFDRRKPLVAT